MKSEMSFFNRGILYNNFKGLGWFGIVYSLILFFCIPLSILMIYSKRDEKLYYTMKKIFEFKSEFQSIIILVIPVILALLIFRYLQVKNSAVLVHSLPITRGTLFRTHIITGFIFLILPVFITALLSWIINISFNLGKFYTGVDILKWLGITILMNLIIFLSTVLVGMVTGLSSAQGVLTYIFLLLPTGLSILILVNVEYFLYGFFQDNTIERTLANLSPFIRIIELSYEKISKYEVIGYIVASVVFFFLSSFLYSRRKVESTSQSITFNELRPVFKYGVTFCCMLVGGLYFKETQQNIYWIFFGYFVGSLIGYIVAEIIIKKSLRVFKNLKGYFIYAGVMVLLLLGLNFDITGYENKIPLLENVDNIYFGNNYHHYKESKEKTDIFIDRENLQNIHNLHKVLIEDKENNKYYALRPWGEEFIRIMFAYRMKNGEELIRGYTIPVEKYSEMLKPIYESVEYKKMYNSLLRVNSTQVDKITIRPIANEYTKKAVITDPIHIKEAVGILQKEIILATYEETQDRRASWAEVSVMLENDKNINLSWNKNYKHFEQWLKARGYWENSRILPEDINYALVEKIDRQKFSESEVLPTEEDRGKMMEISDKAQLEECLSNLSHWGYEEEYYIRFFSEEKHELYSGSFDNNTVPAFIKVFFNKQ